MINKFRNEFAETTFRGKYAQPGAETWPELARALVTNMNDEAGNVLSSDEVSGIISAISEMKFIPGGRYLYYANRKRRYYNNCYLLRAEEDTREDWAELSWKSERALMTGGGIGIDYSVYRPAGAKLNSTGGTASGPLPKMKMINEIGRHVMQGGSRRSAMYASLDWDHDDIPDFLAIKDWDREIVPGVTLADAKEHDFNYPVPMDMTNISVNYNDKWSTAYKAGNETAREVFRKNVEQALRTGEPGFSFNLNGKERETLRNACTEVCSADDSDVCNLGSLNMALISDLAEFTKLTELATKFLLAGTLAAELPYDKVYETREKNRRLGLGLMGVHEWLLQREARYEMTPELGTWLDAWADVSSRVSKDTATSWGISVPVANRAIAPTGTIGILAGTSTGIEPVFAVAYKRRYLTDGKDWNYQYVVDGVAQSLIDDGIKPEAIETSSDLAKDPERRLKFQADVQVYVDQSISSTINLPAWGTEHNNADLVPKFGDLLADYADKIRGFTCYPDGARGGQPLTPCSYYEAKDSLGQVFTESHDVCDITGKGGSCGV